ncbi:MAG: hypothetical protein ABW003_09735 [Microvirga sp.]
MTDPVTANLMITGGCILVGAFIWAADRLNREKFNRTNEMGVLEFENYSDYLSFQGRMIQLKMLGLVTFVPGIALVFFGMCVVFKTVVKP